MEFLQENANDQRKMAKTGRIEEIGRQFGFDLRVSAARSKRAKRSVNQEAICQAASTIEGDDFLRRRI